MSPQTALQVKPVEDSFTHTSNVVRYVIYADKEPSVLPRILENFSLRNLVPDRLSAEIRGEQLMIEVEISGLSAREISHLELRMQNILPVLTVRAG